MTGLVTTGQQPVTVAQFPVSIDYPAALALRQMALVGMNCRNTCWHRK